MNKNKDIINILAGVIIGAFVGWLLTSNTGKSFLNKILSKLKQ